MEEYTERDYERQDEVDNAIMELLNLLSGQEMVWNIEDIGEVRDVVETIIVDKRHIMTSEEFYP